MEQRTRELLYLSLGKFCNLLGGEICIACKQINCVNPAAASLADRRGCAAAVLHSGAGHTSFVSETVPRATYADEFLFFPF